MTSLLINGEPCEHVAAADRGLHYGDGLFETLQVRGGALPLWDRHWRRLSEGCARLGIEGIEEQVLREEGEHLCRGVTQAVLKIIVTRGTGGRGYRPPDNAAVTRIVARHPWPIHPAQYWREGVAVRLCQTRLGRNPALAGIKHLNRLEQVLARREWRDGDVAEGLMQDDLGRVISGTMTNLFIVKHGQPVTPSVAECGVAGVMRARLLEMMSVNEAAVSVEALQAADEIFLCNAVIGIWPVRRVEQRRYAVGPVTRRIMATLQAEGLIDHGSDSVSD